MSVSVCLFFVPYSRPQFWADLHDIWHVASLYPPNGHGGQRALLYTPVNSELANGRRNVSSAVGASLTERRKRENERLVLY